MRASIPVCFFISLLIGIVPFGVFAQEADSVQVHDLEEVVVEAQLQRTSAQSTVFTPTMRQKNSAQNAVDLLRRLAIPQININLVDNAITTSTGSAVSVFINFLPARQEDLEGLLTTDVRRVEYLDFPADPRFEGKEHVVHFIVHKYEYGGYTKLSARENFLTGLSSTVSLYSKFAYKQMLWDLYLGAFNRDLKHVGSSRIGEYSLLNGSGEKESVTRRELVMKSQHKENTYPVTLRTVFETDNIRISNLVGFSYSEEPVAKSSGFVSYQPARIDSFAFLRENPTQQYFFTYGGNFAFSLTNSLQLSVSPYASYGRVTDNTLYRSSAPNTASIENNAQDDQYRYDISSTLSKKIATRQRLFFRGYYGVRRNNVTYTGNTPYENKFIARFAGSSIGYNFSNATWTLRSDISLQWEENRINNQSITKIYPLFNISAGFSASSRHSFQTYFHYGSNYPDASIKTPNILKDNELLYFTGNSQIDLSRQFSYNLSYHWIPNNAFSSSLYGQYYGELNLYVPVFKHHNHGQALLRSYSSDAQYHRIELGTSLNYKLLDGKLQFAVSPSITFFRILGYYDMFKTPFNINGSAIYYLYDFYFQAAYQSKFYTIQGNRAVYYEERDFWQLQVGWNKNNFSIRFSANNLFRSDWLASTEKLMSRLYTETVYRASDIFHRRLNLSIVYTFGYGKKVQQNNEVSQQQGNTSAILK